MSSINNTFHVHLFKIWWTEFTLGLAESTNICRWDPMSDKLGWCIIFLVLQQKWSRITRTVGDCLDLSQEHSTLTLHCTESFISPVITGRIIIQNSSQFSKITLKWNIRWYFFPQIHVHPYCSKEVTLSIRGEPLSYIFTDCGSTHSCEY